MIVYKDIKEDDGNINVKYVDRQLNNVHRSTNIECSVLGTVREVFFFNRLNEMNNIRKNFNVTIKYLIKSFLTLYMLYLCIISKSE